MAISNHTGVDEITNLVNSEFIEAQVNLAVETPYIYDAVASIIGLQGRATATYTHPIRTRLAVAAALADGAEFSHEAMATTQTTSTAARYAASVFVDERANRLSLHNEYAVGLQLVVEACRLKRDTDVVGVGASLTNNNSGTNATIFDYAKLDADLTTFSLLCKEAQSADLVLHPQQHKDLKQSMLASQASLYASIFGGEQSRALGTVAQGVGIGQIGNVMIHTSARVPAADTTGKGGFLVQTGRCIAIADTLGFDAMVTPDNIRARGAVIHCAVDYAVHVLDQARGMQIVSRAA